MAKSFLTLSDPVDRKVHCPSLSPEVCSNSCPLSQWCYTTITSCPLLLHLLSIFPSIRVFSSESVLHIRWPKDWSFSFSICPSNEYSGLISFGNWLLWSPWCPRDSQESSPAPQLETSILQCSAFFMIQVSHPYLTPGKIIGLNIWTFVSDVVSLLFNKLKRS